MRQESATLAVDALVARIAARQHGAITTRQLVDAGLDYAGVARRVAAGRLHRVHRGVYAVGHRALSNEGRWMAAVLACGPGAFLSHRSAAELWRLIEARPGPVQVTVRSTSGRRRRDGLAIHRSSALLTSQTTLRTGVPVTKPDRTLSDLRATVDPRLYRKALRQAEFLRLPTPAQPSDRTRSELELAFRRLCRRHGLPQPEVNVRIGPYLVDFLWRDQGLVVETDAYGTHGGRVMFEADRARDVQLKLMGYGVVRFTYRQVMEEPATVAAALAALLDR